MSAVRDAVDLGGILPVIVVIMIAVLIVGGKHK